LQPGATESTIGDFEEQIAVNLTGVFAVGKAVAETMKLQKKG
jgi:NAD(P)-dependent dehydrogenase (short-subunit alcohol dehydrogenase family)